MAVMDGMIRSSGIAEASVHLFPLPTKWLNLGCFMGQQNIFQQQQKTSLNILHENFWSCCLLPLTKVNSMIKAEYDVGEYYKRAYIYGYNIQWWHYQKKIISFFASVINYHKLIEYYRLPSRREICFWGRICVFALSTFQRLSTFIGL